MQHFDAGVLARGQCADLGVAFRKRLAGCLDIRIVPRRAGVAGGSAGRSCDVAVRRWALRVDRWACRHVFPQAAGAAPRRLPGDWPTG